MKRLLAALVAAGIVLAAAVLPAQGDENDWTVIRRGLYLTQAGDCAACHTAPNGEAFAGGYTLPTPFGTIYSANITPDQQTGLGSWTPDDFYRAMHEGRSKDGTRLYPAFPYTHYTMVTREDTDAIFAYLKTLKPVHNLVPPPKFPWPLDWRFVLSGWNLINFEPHAFQPTAGKSAAYNRGKYLVEGLAHCSMCHSPKNVLGAEEDGDDRFTGGSAEGWWAPSLTGNDRDGIGGWSKQELVDYLKYGRNDRSAAFGPMAEVVRISTQHLNDADLDAIATYFKEMPSSKSDGAGDKNLSEKAMDTGALVYAAQCSACHGPDGKGVPGMFGPLKGSSLAQGSNPATMVKLILDGARAVPTDKFPTPQSMPAFGWKLTDDEVAAVATYVRNSFGNAAPAVSTDAVASVRDGG